MSGSSLAIDTSQWVCRRCGCTEDRACEGGCYWVAQNLCSKCQPFGVGRPLSEGQRMVTVRFPRSAYTKLRAAAGAAGLSMNAFIVQQIDLAIQRAEQANG